MTSTHEASASLQALTRADLIYSRLPETDRESILRELSRRLAEGGVVADGETLYRLLEEREELGSTGIGHGVAVPHCKVDGLDRVVLAVGLSKEEIDFDSADGLPVRVFFVLLSPPDQPAAHLQSLAAVSRWAQGEGHLERLLACSDTAEIFTVLGGEDGDEKDGD